MRTAKSMNTARGVAHSSAARPKETAPSRNSASATTLVGGFMRYVTAIEFGSGHEIGRQFQVHGGHSF